MEERLIYGLIQVHNLSQQQPQQLQTNSFEAQISKPKQSGAQESGDDAGFD